MDLKRINTLTERLNDYVVFLSLKEADLAQSKINIDIELNKPRIIAFMYHSESEYKKDIEEAEYAVKWAEKRIKKVITDLNNLK